MNESRKLKAYSLLEGIESRTKALEAGVTGVRPLQPKDALRLVQEIAQLNNQLREIVDIS